MAGDLTEAEYKTAEKVKTLFGDWPETILWSVLQGKMGRMFADNSDSPESAAAVLGDFVFLAGTPSEELIRFTAELDDYPLDMCILMPQNESWEQAIEKKLEPSEKIKSVQKVTRYATAKNPEHLKRPEVMEHLRRLSERVPAHFEIKAFDEEIYQIARDEYWSRSQAAQFRNYEEFHQHGLGFAAFLGGIMAAGASTYSWYEGGIEVQIDTDTGFREMGLAKCCGARLILECLERNLYPSWDAHNLQSLALAESLGYEPAGEYTAYEVWQK